MTNKDFVEKLKEVEKLKTLYVMGCFGAPMTQENKKRYVKNHEYNTRPTRVVMINNADSNTFGFDCVNLIKGVLWGFNGDNSKIYGGAVYASNGVPDIGADQMIKVTENNKDFSKGLDIGEVVWLQGHIGVYVGNGKVIECTPKWTNNVQYSNLGNIGYNTGNTRIWTAHGHLPYIEYIKEDKKDNNTVYKTFNDIPQWGKEAVQYFSCNGYLAGTGNGELNLNYDMVRLIVIMYRLLKDKGVI